MEKHSHILRVMLSENNYPPQTINLIYDLRNIFLNTNSVGQNCVAGRHFSVQLTDAGSRLYTHKNDFQHL